MSNRDVNGVLRGACAECECTEFLAGDNVRCDTCGHVPNKHSIMSSSIKETLVQTNTSPVIEHAQQNIVGYLTNATMQTNHSINTNPFETTSIEPLDFPVKMNNFECQSMPITTGDYSNIDVRGVTRGSCTQCECVMYQRPTQGFKCSSCYHPPIKHTGVSSTQILSSSQPLQSLNNFKDTNQSKISTKVNITPTTPQGVNNTHHVMTSFKSDPPDVVSVSADNSLIVPTGQPVKITIEINIVPMTK
ncbi:hypothetical protein LOD99_13165 [Oopsacas minuta]|uniref:Uncharacterized protein n=1 Tax=Oopsacas minuta TaxID=111878 RepID=A0AAV7JB23_9METZ|nr:hypothetical protein LOD99_13165 [Oopsacas minuta]